MTTTLPPPPIAPAPTPGKRPGPTAADPVTSAGFHHVLERELGATRPVDTAPHQPDASGRHATDDRAAGPDPRSGGGAPIVGDDRHHHVGQRRATDHRAGDGSHDRRDGADDPVASTAAAEATDPTDPTDRTDRTDRTNGSASAGGADQGATGNADENAAGAATLAQAHALDASAAVGAPTSSTGDAGHADGAGSTGHASAPVASAEAVPSEAIGPSAAPRATPRTDGETRPAADVRAADVPAATAAADPPAARAIEPETAGAGRAGGHARVATPSGPTAVPMNGASPVHADAIDTAGLTTAGEPATAGTDRAVTLDGTAITDSRRVPEPVERTTAPVRTPNDGTTGATGTTASHGTAGDGATRSGATATGDVPAATPAPGATAGTTTTHTTSPGTAPTDTAPTDTMSPETASTDTARPGASPQTVPTDTARPGAAADRASTDTTTSGPDTRPDGRARSVDAPIDHAPDAAEVPHESAPRVSTESTRTTESRPTTATLAADLARLVADERVRRTEIARLGTTSRLGMELATDDLGVIRVEATDRQGALHLHLAADDPATRAMLTERMHELRHLLRDGGVELAGLDVDQGRSQARRDGEADPRADRTGVDHGGHADASPPDLSSTLRQGTADDRLDVRI